MRPSPPLLRGACLSSEPPGECSSGARGSWRLGGALASWTLALAACRDLCARCSACNFVSFTNETCEWYARCNLNALRSDEAYRTVRAKRIRVPGLPPCFTPEEQCFPGWQAGSCGVTDDNQLPSEPCRNASSGNWKPVASATQCVRLCKGCPRCNYVSYSVRDFDCSWFETCLQDDVQSQLEAHAISGYCTLHASAKASEFLQPTLTPPFTNRRAKPTRVAIIIPVYPPSFREAVEFVLSMVACNQQSSYTVFLVFSSQQDRASFAKAENSSVFPRSSAFVKTLVIRPFEFRPESYKKLMGVKHVFSNSPGLKYDYALTLDSDTIFQSTYDFHGYFSQWSARKAVLAARLATYASPKKGLPWITRASCARVGLDSKFLGKGQFFLWWNDAPVYERAGFSDYLSRVNWSSFENHRPVAESGWDHSSYLCYKALVKNWEIIDLPQSFERATSDEQRCISTKRNYSFLWSRNEDERRLFLFHIDRREYPKPRFICGKQKLYEPYSKTKLLP
ncbi:MAG: hypothetical protein SGPRY_011756 [Prymnesium sp.]